MAQNVNPASSSSSGYEKDAMERNSATSSSQVRIYGEYTVGLEGIITFWIQLYNKRWPY